MEALSNHPAFHLILHLVITSISCVLLHQTFSEPNNCYERSNNVNESKHSMAKV